jgi:hypothetical protein
VDVSLQGLVASDAEMEPVFAHLTAVMRELAVRVQIGGRVWVLTRRIGNAVGEAARTAQPAKPDHEP